MRRSIVFLLLVVMAVVLTACGTSASSGSSSLPQNSVPESVSPPQSQSTTSESPSQSQTAVSSNSMESSGTASKVSQAPSEVSEAIGSAEIPTAEPEEQEEEKVDQKILVAYFSATGTTESLAEYAAEILDAGLYEIIAAEPYTDADLAYYTGGRADQEQNDPSARPGISGSVEDMAQYDIILLGYPIWHGQAPRIISTFLESYDFSGKTIIPFCTSHNSGVGSSASNLHGLCSATTNWKDGTRFAGDTTKVEIAAWLDSI